jgi:flavin-dependent dehydrogenase
MTVRELARRGLGVLLVDRSAFPRWKVCGGCLNKRALGTLAEVGLEFLTSQCHAVPLERVQLAARDCSAVLPLPGGVALSREAFDAAMVRAALAAGAAFLPGTYATLAGAGPQGRIAFLRQGTREWPTAARFVVAADGLSGRLLAGERKMQNLIIRNSRIGAGAVVSGAPSFYERGTIHMACGDDGYVGLVRLEDGGVDIAAALERRAVQDAGGPSRLAAEILQSVGWPAIAGMENETWRGTPGLTRRAFRVAGERLFVVGDSAGYVEPFTGEGIAWALDAGVALASLAVEAAREWTPRLAARWTSIFRRTIGDRRACRAAARLLRHPRLTRGVIALLDRFPVLGLPVIRRLNRRPVKKVART